MSKFCTKCGNQLALDVSFCNKCGTQTISDSPSIPYHQNKFTNPTPHYHPKEMGRIIAYSNGREQLESNPLYHIIWIIAAIVISAGCFLVISYGRRIGNQAIVIFMALILIYAITEHILFLISYAAKSYIYLCENGVYGVEISKLSVLGLANPFFSLQYSSISFIKTNNFAGALRIGAMGVGKVYTVSAHAEKLIPSIHKNLSNMKMTQTGPNRYERIGSF